MNNFLLVGAGGTGTHLLPALHLYLAAHYAAKDWMLFIMDGDTVEAKNLERQFFDPAAITINKAVAATAALKDAEHVTAITDYLSEDNIARFIRDGDTILVCVDNFTVRKRIEDHCLTLANVVVINGGNEIDSGSVQLWIRENNENITPRLSYLHPEVAIAVGEDRAEMTCQQAAALPGGLQTLLANMQSATWMLTALWRYHEELHIGTDANINRSWTELQFDLREAYVWHMDQRASRYWNN
jgi:hypothetical protein